MASSKHRVAAVQRRVAYPIEPVLAAKIWIFSPLSLPTTLISRPTFAPSSARGISAPQLVRISQLSNIKMKQSEIMHGISVDRCERYLFFIHKSRLRSDGSRADHMPVREDEASLEVHDETRRGATASLLAVEGLYVVDCV